MVVTQRDRAVPPEAQYGLAAAIPGATLFRYDGGHISCVEDDFGRTMARAVTHVAEQAERLVPDTDVIDLRERARLKVAR